MAQSIVMAVLMVTATALTLAGVLLIAALFERRHGTGQGAAAGLGGNRVDAVFLFEDGALIDANERAEALLERLGGETAPWPALRRFLQTGMLDIDAALQRLPESRSVALAAGDGSGLAMRAEWLSGSLRLTISDSAADEGGILLDRLSLRAMEEELALLRQLSEVMPAIAWREDAEGKVIWANHAYLRNLAPARGGDAAIAWPLPALFSAGAAGSTARATLSGESGRGEYWFDIMRIADGDGQLAFALPADSAHRAEKTRRAFVQTLTKTFATLPTGLAVFDRARRLQLFNPALADLTGLEPEFLTSRPGLEGFLNRLREKRILPEPRDFRSWSRRLLEIEKGAETSDFEETWLLPGGQTYRVSASPHPDGALAFLIEDVTSEIHMSRNIRAELENCQSALNLLDEAIALFSHEGHLVHANAAFSGLWTLEGEDSIGGVSLSAALEAWREASADPALWDRIATITRRGNAEMSVSGEMELADGERLHVKARRAGNGMVMIGFSPVEDASGAEKPAPAGAAPTAMLQTRSAKQPQAAKVAPRAAVDGADDIGGTVSGIGDAAPAGADRKHHASHAEGPADEGTNRAKEGQSPGLNAGKPKGRVLRTRRGAQVVRASA
ncbi:MAG: PAS-domain containing protein [Pararhodobacter sp.]|nr:PAS-domain containing protein [Pararhodobacter sp.]